MTTPELNAAVAAPPRTVQAYIDETPIWRDGTVVETPPLTPMQALIWVLASSGKFFEGMIIFMIGIMLPIVSYEYELQEVGHGLVSAASLAGILVGASVLGGLADQVGRRTMFIAEMLIFTFFLVLVCLSPHVIWLLVCLFGLGLALGCDYPTAHLILSETIPSRWRGKLIISAFAFQAVGALFGSLVGYVILSNVVQVDAWRWMFATALVPAVIVTALRFYVVESPNWLFSCGEREAARESLVKLLKRVPRYPKGVELAECPVAKGDTGEPARFGKLFSKKSRRATILASVPWFLQDLGTYGIGIFTPVILASTFGLGRDHATTIAQIIHEDRLAAKGAAVIDIFLVVGILCAIFLSDRIGRTRLQAYGFIGCAVGLALGAISYQFGGTTQTIMIFVAFMLFNFMTNIGPNAQTYVIAGEVFPTRIRARGAGFAASVGKVGAVTTAFLFPILLADIGAEALLSILVLTSLLGAWVTTAFSIDTANINLEKLDEE